MIDECIGFFFGGQVTISAAVIHLILNSIQEPTILSRIRSELKSQLGENEEREMVCKELNYENINELHYLTWCMNETLRTDTTVKFAFS